MVLATQNPVETETTFALPAAQLDRFLFKLSMGYPTPREEAAMLRTVGDGAAFADLRPLLSPEEVNRFTREIRQGRLSDPVVAYKKEGYEMFEQMIAAIQEETLRRLNAAIEAL